LNTSASISIILWHWNTCSPF